MRYGSIIFFILSIILLDTAPSHAAKRVALVIGNANYRVGGQLRNPVNDSASIAKLFKDAGFDTVESRSDIGIAAMRRAIGDFADKAQDSDIAVVYYAGHGIEVGGVNYLIPVDAVLARDFDVEDETISLDRVLRAIEPAQRLRLVILDACRDNPFGQTMKRSTRAIGRGFAKVEPTTTDTLVAFAAKAGATAADGRGEHSPFTAALLQHLATPGLDIMMAFRHVRDTVTASTSPRQEPFLYGSLGGHTISIVDAPPSPPAADLAASDWKSVETSTSIGALEAFRRRYPASFQAELATLRIEELKKAQIAASPPPAVRADPPPKPPMPVTVAPSPPPAAAPAIPPVIQAVVAPPVAPPPPDPCTGVLTVSSVRQCATPLTAAQERSLQPKDSFRECETCPEMVVVPNGTFTMGSPRNERDRDPDEGPQHVVTIREPFAVGKFHVTRDQFAAFISATGSDAASSCVAWQSRPKQRATRSWEDPGFDQDGSHPVVCVNWNDAKAYVDWLAGQTGKPYRLLSEAEWEYAARAGSSTRYSYGNDEKDLCRHGNSADQTARSANSTTVRPFASCRDGFANTSPVGSFTANGFGLFDMQGNAAQWTEDCYHDGYRDAPTDGSAWTSGDCALRSLRGGAWDNSPNGLRVANRFWNVNDTSSRVYDSGLRVARTLITP
jgi:formylglycine-generating enzyme required for sulfatase activity/uncharacterized caspase-like protein